VETSGRSAIRGGGAPMNTHPTRHTPVQHGTSIENGHFVLTMMPSLYCALNCPHCYLSKAERRDTTRLRDDQLAVVLESVRAYYQTRNLPRVSIHAYQYGGEPTSMGTAAFASMLDTLDAAFPSDEGYDLRHTLLTALVGVDLDAWAPLVHERCGGYLQSSYDGRMRGGGYLTTWLDQMAKARRMGLTMATISVVNSRLLADGPESTLDTLADLGVVEASFLPFMENLQNTGKIYDRLAPSMEAWSRFMIELTEHWIARTNKGDAVPEIGQMRFILAQAEAANGLANTAAQTLFLLPNGDWALPDYRNGWTEYMNRFGNGLHQGFEAVLRGDKRKAYLRRQAMRNGNLECSNCAHGAHCVMEFWKPNRPDDDCFGGKRYVEWVLHNRQRIEEALARTTQVAPPPRAHHQRHVQAWIKGKPYTEKTGGLRMETSLY
jgi:sulfatase maturation enzyme AslB (radical SAM superfamily)